jgi:hypothetical protein
MRSSQVIGEIRQRDDLAIDLVGVGVGLDVLRHHLGLVGAEITVERLGPTRGGPLRRADDVDQHHVERGILRREDGVEILLLRLRGRSAHLDLDLHVRVLLLVLVGDLAHHVGTLLAAGKNAQRRLRRRGH